MKEKKEVKQVYKLFAGGAFRDPESQKTVGFLGLPHTGKGGMTKLAIKEKLDSVISAEPISLSLEEDKVHIIPGEKEAIRRELKHTDSRTSSKFSFLKESKNSKFP